MEKEETQERETGNERTVEPGKIDLWCAYPDDLLAPEAAAAWLALLNPAERARHDRFRFEKRRREHIATHALKRLALSASHPAIAPEAWQFVENDHGKPSIDPDGQPNSTLHFNLSNSPKIVVCLIARDGEAGVDVEPITRAPEIVKIAKRFFSAAEQTQLALLGEPEREDRALSLWTLKEAYIKARGQGLTLPLAKFSFLFSSPRDIRLEIDPSLNDDPRRWQFRLVDYAQHRIAIVVESNAPLAINLREARPFQTQPGRLKNYGDFTVGARQ